jgi:hypothetical protein
MAAGALPDLLGLVRIVAELAVRVLRHAAAGRRNLSLVAPATGRPPRLGRRMWIVTGPALVSGGLEFRRLVRVAGRAGLGRRIVMTNMAAGAFSVLVVGPGLHRCLPLLMAVCAVRPLLGCVDGVARGALGVLARRGLHVVVAPHAVCWTPLGRTVKVVAVLAVLVVVAQLVRLVATAASRRGGRKAMRLMARRAPRVLLHRRRAHQPDFAFVALRTSGRCGGRRVRHVTTGASSMVAGRWRSRDLADLS